jgi:mannose-6-phosphate isomerase-like protein (cupin superfamily)
MMSAATVIENPLSGERIVIGEHRGDVLRWELFLAPHGRVPSTHVHPLQEERFILVEGTMRFRVGGRRKTVVAGDTVVVPAGTIVETRPALRLAEMLVAAAEMAQEQHRRGDRLPRLAELATFMNEFRDEVRAPYVPARLVRAVLEDLVPLERVWRRARPG